MSYFMKKTTSLPLRFYLMTTDKKQQCYPLCFISWEKRHCYALRFIWSRWIKQRQCYPLRFFWWRGIKNDSVTPYVLFHKKRQCYPLRFIWRSPMKNNNVTPYVLFHKHHKTFHKKRQCYPLSFISLKTKVLRLTFYLMMADVMHKYYFWAFIVNAL
jgi:hypothetical protein